MKLSRKAMLSPCSTQMPPMQIISSPSRVLTTRITILKSPPIVRLPRDRDEPSRSSPQGRGFPSEVLDHDLAERPFEPAADTAEVAPADRRGHRLETGDAYPQRPADRAARQPGDAEARAGHVDQRRGAPRPGTDAQLAGQRHRQARVAP